MGGQALGGRRASFREAEDIGTALLRELDVAGAITRGCLCGSVRRKQPQVDGTVGDVDLVVLAGPALADWLSQRWGIQKNGKPAHAGLVEGVQVDLLETTPEGWGAALAHATGSKKTNIVQRSWAKARGFLLNEKGVWKEGARVAGQSEREVYDVLGLDWLWPEER